ncbi:MAG TPA: PQQ-binding-like beta-propeller repeat protein [Gemmatimonadales bacterium]|nr:PQQ-binding-like beta-propeller repeat protein [Gemmatimonadales bacterium]
MNDWPAYNRTLTGDRFSPLTEINRANVANLRQICTYTLPEVTSLQTGPLVVSGTMYFTTDTISYAINASTCAEKWKQVRHSETPSFLAVHRGFAYLNGRLFRGTSDAHVIALNAADGRTLWDIEMDAKGPGVSMPMAPIAAHGMVYVGNAGGDQVGITGHVYALDARDGHVVWKFDVVPAAGPARATWTNPRLPISGGGFWTSFALDTIYGVLYVPAGNPAPDFDIGRRTGDNLYTNSIIALDAATGRMLGYNQLVKRDSHDWDVDAPPALVTTRAGRTIVASANKDGLLSILDRSRLMTRQVTTAGDLTAALPLLSQTPTTTRENVDVPLSRDSVVRFCPGIVGGVEWNGAAYSPLSNTLFVGAVDWCARVQLKRDTTDVPTAGTSWLGAENGMETMFDPPDQARGWITAYDAENGLVRWKYRAAHPILGGVTPTAGGLVFAADLGGQIYALDANSGRVLWQTDARQSTGGGVVTYAAGGRQLLGVAAGMKSPVWPGGAAQSHIVVFGLR